MGYKGRRLKNFLIDREFQFRYAGQMAVVSAGLTGMLGFIIYRFNAEASRVVDVRAMDPTDADAQVLKEAFARSGFHLLLALIGFGVVLSVVLALWQIVTTHKVAGPLYYIAHQARRIRDGYLGPLHPLRKGDMLHDFFENFREMHHALRERARSEAEIYGRLAASVEKAGDPESAEELRTLQKEREEALKK
ncbi:MAG: hypothetical protein EXR72_26385 [Myxococcales bacterium]|nr:hypothetical protein [Myxococcales bacterium]